MAHSTIDNLLPREVAFRAENAGVIKANLDAGSTFMLALLAGAFIGFGAVFSTTVLTGNGLDGAVRLPFGVMRLLGGSVFCLGLILVVVAGAEMFTGNVLLVMAAASRKITIKRLLRNWGIVFVGNFVGATSTALLIFFSGHHTQLGGQVGLTALDIAEYKCSLGFGAALTRAIFCNTLVCLAIWLALSGRTVIDKVTVILFPIAAFVTSGFEHSVANMYFIPSGLYLKFGAPAEFWQALSKTPDAFPHLTVSNFLWGNLLPVTLGNTLGGLLVGLMYWGIYCRPSLLNVGADDELLGRLSQSGRRQAGRIPHSAYATLRYQGKQFHGKVRNFGLDGLMAEFYVASGLPTSGDTIVLDYDDGSSLKAADVEGLIVAVNRGKNLMGRDYLLYSVKFVEIGPNERQAIARLVGD